MIDQHHRFERGILKVIALIGLVRFGIAIFLSDPAVDGYADLYLDIATAIAFLTGLILVHWNASNRILIACFFAPLIGLLWASFYYYNGLASSNEINAFAVIIIISLTIQGRMPLLFVGVFLVGVCTIMYLVETNNLQTLQPEDYKTGTTTLLLVTLANLFMIYHAKNVFDESRTDLNTINNDLTEKTTEIQQKRTELTAQNHELTLLKNELEEKVLERTERLQEQKDSIEAYLQLMLTELVKPYDKTIKAINELQSSDDDPMIDMVKTSGKRLEMEIEKLRERLLNTHE